MTIVQYEQHILQRSATMERKKSEKILQVRGQRKYGFFLIQMLSFYFYNWSEEKKKMLQMVERLFLSATLSL